MTISVVRFKAIRNNGHWLIGGQIRRQSAPDGEEKRSDIMYTNT